jgi:uncharacterized DUF497 family protein
VRKRCGIEGFVFEDAAEVFAGVAIDIQDMRRDYGEPRIMTVGHLHGRMVIVVWTPRRETRHLISMRKANEREQARYAQRFEEA